MSQACCFCSSLLFAIASPVLNIFEGGQPQVILEHSRMADCWVMAWGNWAHDEMFSLMLPS
jgi:hypothetical protein